MALLFLEDTALSPDTLRYGAYGFLHYGKSLVYLRLADDEGRSETDDGRAVSSEQYKALLEAVAGDLFHQVGGGVSRGFISDDFKTQEQSYAPDVSNDLVLVTERTPSQSENNLP